MPRPSQRIEYIAYLITHAEFSIVVRNREKEDYYVEKLSKAFQSQDILPRATLPSDDHLYTHKFSRLADERFRMRFRTTRGGFLALMSLIQNHSTFHKSSKQQTHPRWQLAVALHRFGHYGSRMNVSKLAVDFDISVGSVTEFTKRVIEALTSLSPQWIMWPDESRRKEISDVMSEEGFPNCVRFLDGTTIPLSQKPAINGTVY